MKDTIRIPRRALAAWARVMDKVRADLPDEQFSDGAILALLIDDFDRRGGGPGVMPADAPAYEAPPDELAVLNTRLDVQSRRIAALERKIGELSA